VTNKLDTAIAQHPGAIGLMTHTIAGYPDWPTCTQLVHTMAQCGVRVMEIQIPFTDPLADGPTIMAANQAALDAGVRPEDALRWAQQMGRELPEVAFLIMTYANIPYAMGLEQFLTCCKEAGIQGVILPDLPVDEAEGAYAQAARHHGLHPVLVVSPDTPTTRLDQILPQASGLLYTTLKVGITGASAHIASAALDYLRSLRQRTRLPIAAGFGISHPQHVAGLRGFADLAVVGSHVLNLLQQGGLAEVRSFLHACLS
jgi:tryptophan synthase alpha chain